MAHAMDEYRYVSVCVCVHARARVCVCVMAPARSLSVHTVSSAAPATIPAGVQKVDDPRGLR